MSEGVKQAVSIEFADGVRAALKVVRDYADGWRNCLSPSEHTEETVRQAEEVADEIESFLERLSVQ